MITRSYAWGVVYLSIIVTEMVYAKHVTATIQLSTALVLYQNTIALFLRIRPFASLISGEFQSLRLLVQTPEAEAEPLMTMTTLVPLLSSCVLAIGISFSAWGTRSPVSATQFTVLGVACKRATVAINALAWSHHAPSSRVCHRRVHPRVGGLPAVGQGRQGGTPVTAVRGSDEAGPSFSARSRDATRPVFYRVAAAMARGWRRRYKPAAFMSRG